jgi:ABC-type Co2+ transport system permease subunit
LVGVILAAWLLGPALAVWTMGLVLATQAVLLGDGGVFALGANTLNMGIVPAALWLAFRRFSPTPAAWHVGLAAALAIPLAAGLIVIETAAFRDAAQLAGWASFAATMLGTHLLGGVLEGLFSAGIVLVAFQQPAAIRRPAFVAAACAAALLVALALPVSSALPDGYEAAAESSGMGWLLAP